VKIHLPDRHDALALVGAVAIIAGVWQVHPWLAFVVAGGFLLYIAVATEPIQPPEKP
jgi:hypothetical protein